MSKLTCPDCGQQHDELPVYSFQAPALYNAATPEERARDFELGPDLCRYKDEHYMIRGRLQIPVKGRPDEPLEFLTWVAVSKDNWWRYRTTFMDFNATGVGVFYGWLANQLPGYEDTLNIKLAVETVGQAQRPMFTAIEAPDHQLMKDQQSGVSLDGAMRYLHQHGGF